VDQYDVEKDEWKELVIKSVKISIIMTILAEKLSQKFKTNAI
jgi:hypothetical protein